MFTLGQWDGLDIRAYVPWIPGAVSERELHSARMEEESMRTTLLIAGALALAGTTALAAPKPEKASRALVRGAKQLAKLKSYTVDFSVSGGVAKGADHALIEQRVNENWTAQVRGKVAQLNSGEAFRLRRADLKGAIKQSLNWKALLATDEGRLIGRLFKDPEVTLAMAVRSKKRARWLAPEGGEASSAAPSDEPSEGTRAQRSGSGAEADDGPLPTVLVVEGPAIEAIRHFEQIVSSGCFSEG